MKVGNVEVGVTLTDEARRVIALNAAVEATRLPGSYPAASTVTAFAGHFEQYLKEGESE